MPTPNDFIGYLLQTKDFLFFLLLNAQCGFGLIFSDTWITTPFHAVIAIIYLDWGFPNKRLIISFVRDALRTAVHIWLGGGGRENTVFWPLQCLMANYTLKKMKLNHRHGQGDALLLHNADTGAMSRAVRYKQTHTKVPQDCISVVTRSTLLSSSITSPVIQLWN